MVTTMKCLQCAGHVTESAKHDKFVSFLQDDTYQSRYMEDPDRNVNTKIAQDKTGQ
jgi:hypothetical protein